MFKIFDCVEEISELQNLAKVEYRIARECYADGDYENAALWQQFAAENYKKIQGWRRTQSLEGVNLLDFVPVK